MNKGKKETAVVKSTEKKEDSTEGRNEARKMFISSWKISTLHCLSSPSVSHKAIKPNTAALRNSEE
jgi:hypothetical protein